MICAIYNPKKIECKSCGWSKTVQITFSLPILSDVYYENQPCEKCGKKSLLLRRLKTHEHLTNMFARGQK